PLARSQFESRCNETLKGCAPWQNTTRQGHSTAAEAEGVKSAPANPAAVLRSARFLTTAPARADQQLRRPRRRGLESQYGLAKEIGIVDAREVADDAGEARSDQLARSLRDETARHPAGRRIPN